MATQTIERPVQRPAADLEAQFPGRYLSVTSFKRDGTGVATPVWFVSDGSRLLALTDLHSAKVRRVRRDPRVLVASCRADGNLRGEPVPARVEVLTETPDLERVQKLLLERYKLTYRAVMLVHRLGRRRRAGDHGRTARPGARRRIAHAAARRRALRSRRRRVAVTDNQEFNRQVRRAAVTTVALGFALLFGIFVLAGGDWIPGGITV